jgi:hypothetical protein
MTIIIDMKPEVQEALSRQAAAHGVDINSYAASLLEEAAHVPAHLPKPGPEGESTATIARRLASFGKRHGLSLGGSTIKDLLRESRP